MSSSWDAERGAKAAVWFSFYVLCWLLMQVSCELEPPGNYRWACQPLDVLTELPFLLAFALGQATTAFLCDTLDSERFHSLSKERYLPVVVVGSGITTSALTKNDGFVDTHEIEDGMTTAVNVVSTLLVIAVGLAFVYHFFVAWTTLPGAVMISGGVSTPEDATAPVRSGNRFARYMATAVLVAAFVALNAAFVHRRGDNWNYHYTLLAWVMSLIAIFDDPFSVVWLGVTTGAFLQGVGAYSFQFLFRFD
ncbi:unnamed protein product [Ectocarpus sp. CCAP 1310/34]|nr:unnamed protein product [Ectocarpus sp. CCAP 1310/34]